VQGHVAYPHLADNPIHQVGDVINALTNIEWDQGNEYFPASSFQISNIAGGTGATNVIPETVVVTFNIRFSTEQTAAAIQTRINTEISQLEVDAEIEWTLFGEPFLTEPGALVDACVKAINDELNIDAQLSTSGGTSDGRFIAPTGAQVVELGPVNASIHKVNECVDITTPGKLSMVYQAILTNLLSKSK